MKAIDIVSLLDIEETFVFGLFGLLLTYINDLFFNF